MREFIDTNIFSVSSDTEISWYSTDYTKRGTYLLGQKVKVNEIYNLVDPIIHYASTLTIIDRNTLLEVDEYTVEESLEIDLAPGYFSVEFTPPTFKYESQTGYTDTGIRIENGHISAWEATSIPYDNELEEVENCLSFIVQE